MYVYVRVCRFARLYVELYGWMVLRMYDCMCVCLSVCVFCICVFLYACVLVCMCV